jgi:3-keto steroid reductase
LDGLPQYYDPKDFQATNSGASYQSCKFQVGLAAWGLNDVIQEESPQGEGDGKGPVVRSFLIHPGVVAGNMLKEMSAFDLHAPFPRSALTTCFS